MRADQVGEEHERALQARRRDADRRRARRARISCGESRDAMRRSCRSVRSGAACVGRATSATEGSIATAAHEAFRDHHRGRRARARAAARWRWRRAGTSRRWRPTRCGRGASRWLRDVAEADLDGLAPVADIRRVAIGSDHTGVALKAALRDHAAAPRAGRRRTSAPTAPSRWTTRHRRAGRAPGRARRSRRRHRHRRRRPRLGDRRQQDRRRARGDVHRPDAGALRPRAQRRQRARARRDAGHRPTRRSAIVDTLAGHADAEPRYIRRLAKIRALERTR